MLKYALRRLLEAVPVLVIVIVGTFLLVHSIPGGPFSADKAVPEEVLQALNERYHLNDPIYKQLADYFLNLVRGDLGPSFKYPGRTVTEMVASGLPLTFELGIYALLVSLVIGVLAGVTAGLRPNSLQDYVPMSISMIGICVPSFLMGPLLVLIFGIWLEWLPVSSWDSFAHKILPSITLGGAYAAYVARLGRSEMIEVMHQDYIRTARAKGVPEKWVVIRHALRGALLPIVAFMGPAIAGLLSGSFVVETVFQIPGMGRFYVQSAFNRDYTMILGMTILFSIFITAFNLMSDIAMAWLNPKMRTSGGRR